jgi:hypothetical protein
MPISIIEQQASAINLASIQSRSEEMHRLFDNARESIIALMAFAYRVGVDLPGDQVLEATLSVLVPRTAGRAREVSVQSNGERINIDIDSLDSQGSVRQAVAMQYGVSEQTLLQFERRMSSCAHGVQAGTANVPCNHPACRMTKGVYFSTPAGMIEADRRSINEIWYCHHHREEAFKNEGALADELFVVLQTINQNPGLTQKETGSNREDLAFLESLGLIVVKTVAHRGRVLRYEISLSSSGLSLVGDHRNRTPASQLTPRGT